MKLKIFTFRFSESSGGFDDEALQKYISDKEVIESANHFFVHDKTPYLTVIISYRDMSSEERRRRPRYHNYLNDLDEREAEVYNALREWRTIRASQEGIPPYLIVNNKQIAQMVKLNVRAKTELSKINGIGETKIKRYGADILKVLSKFLKLDSSDKTQTEEVPEK